LEINEMILVELRELTSVVNELAADSKQRITHLETKIKPLFDNGQPGWCRLTDTRITSLEHWRIYLLGATAVIAFSIPLVLRFGLHWI
jgi:hypothetical protein